MAAYQGHRSWNAWNVALWIGNSESTYNYCKELCRKHGRRKAARLYAQEMEGQRTPDGARYNFTCIYAAFEGV